MRGYVEIYKVIENDPELVEAGSNLILDNWSESLAEIMTLNPASLSGPYSGLLETSNFTIQAISYSKSASGFGDNAHGNHPITLSGRNQAVPEIYVINYAGTSSYSSINNIVPYPQPEDDLLSILPSSLSSVMVTYGQNLNLLNLWSSVSSVSSIGASGAHALGCYSSSATGTGRTLAYLFDSTSAFICSGRFGTGAENVGFQQTMDWRGFQRVTGGGSPSQGLVTSSTINTDPYFSGVAPIIYRFLITGRALGAAALYGGIQSIGLWAIDIPRTLANGVTPSFAFSLTNPKIEYKLMAKKVLMRNLGYIEDSVSTAGFNNYSNITGEWYIYFQ